MTANRSPDRRAFDAFCLLVLFGLFIRVAYWFEHSSSPFFAIPVLDQIYYDIFARRLIAGEGLRIFEGFRPVLYPFFLSMIYRIGGGAGIELSILVQHMLGVATALMTGLVSARLFRGHIAGILSGALYILAAPPLFFEGELLITGFLVFLVAVILYAHARACQYKAGSPAFAWLVCGGLLALSVQARGSMLVFLPLYPAFVFYLFVKKRRRRAFLPLLALLGAACVMIGFGFINVKQSGRFHMVPGQGGIAFYAGNKLKADGMIPRQDRVTTQGDVYEDSIQVWAREEYGEAMRAEGREPGAGPYAVSGYWTRRAFEDIASDPARWLRLMARKTWLLFWNHEITNNKSFSFIAKEESLLLRLLPVRWFVLLALAPLGVAAARKGGDRDILFIVLGFIALYAGGIIIFFVNSRYRIPLWPALAVLAGGGLHLFWSAVKSRDRGRVITFSAAIAAVSIFSLTNWPGIKPPSYARDYYFRSMACHMRGRNAEALDDIRRSLMLDPGDFNARFHYGNVLFALGRYTEARKVYSDVSEADSGEYRVWNNLGAAYEAGGDYEGAYASYRKALQINPDSRTALQNTALMELRAGLLDRADGTIARMESLDPNSAITVSAKAFLETARGRPAEGAMLRGIAGSIDPAAAGWMSWKLGRGPVDPALLTGE